MLVIIGSQALLDRIIHVIDSNNCIIRSISVCTKCSTENKQTVLLHFV